MAGAFSAREQLAHIASIVPRFARTGWVGAITLAIGLIVTTVWTLSTKRLYRSEAVVVFERGVQAGGLGREAESSRAIATRLTDMLTSRQRLDRLISEMHLYHDVLEKRGVVDAIDEMRKHIGVNTNEGYTYRVSFHGETREGARNVLQRLLDEVIAEDTKRRTREAEETMRFLDAERAQADDDLKKKEGALAEFLTRHPQLAVEAGGAASAGGLIRAAERDRAGAGGGEVASLEMQAAQLEESLAAAGVRHVGGAALAPPIDPQLTAAHIRAQTEVQLAQHDLAEKQLHLTNEHPDVKQAQRRLAAAEAAERRAAAAITAWRPPAPSAIDTGGADEPNNARVNALRHALAAVRQQIAALKGRTAPRAELPKAAGSVVAIDTDWTRLNREVTEARDRQNQLEGRQFQAQLAATLTAAGQGGALMVIDPPFRPMRPSAGGRLKIALVGAAASLLLALLAMAGLAAFDDRLYAARDIEAVMGDGFVVVIPTPHRLAPRLTAKTTTTTEG